MYFPLPISIPFITQLASTFGGIISPLFKAELCVGYLFPEI